MIKIANRNATV